MLHTIIALEDIFYTSAQNSVEFCPIPYGMATVQKTPDGQRIQSIFSTDPKVYLNPRYGLGSTFGKR